MKRAAVLGLGKMGSRIVYELSKEGVEVIGFDSRIEAVEETKRNLDIDAYVVDATKYKALEAAILGISQVVSALPGSVGFSALKNLVELGIDIVDLSFYREDPDAVAYRARRLGSFVVPDAGVAPGLSNFLVALANQKIGPLKGARVFAGGISPEKKDPLSLAITWNAEDFMSEYVRPARIIKNGELVETDPLKVSGTIEVPGLGKLEFFPTDGLRSLLKTFGELEELAEYTLRWPEHLEMMRLLKKIGVLDDIFIAVGGCIIRPSDVIGRLIEERYSTSKDLVVLIVEAWSKNDRQVYKVIVRPRGEWTAMARATGGFASAVMLAILEGLLKGEGVLYPEKLVENKDVRDFILNYLKIREINVEDLGNKELGIHISKEASS